MHITENQQVNAKITFALIGGGLMTFSPEVGITCYDRFDRARFILPPSGNLHVTDLTINDEHGLYLGTQDGDGAWRIIRSGNNLVIQRKEASTWVTKSTITA
jgi:hypothetical protein